MKLALVNGQRSEPSPQVRASCAYCGREMISKCGRVKIWHWAHKRKESCDPWWESETEWHRNWKNQFPVDWQEIVHTDQTTGEKHVADVKTPFGLVIEFQHSPIELRELESREAFYENLIWVVDGDRGSADPQNFNMGLSTTEPASFEPLAYSFGWWSRSRLLRAEATSHVYLEKELLWRLAHFNASNLVAYFLAADKNDPGQVVQVYPPVLL